VADDDLLLVFAGRLDAEKRIDLLLGMTGRLPGDLRWKLLFVGQGPHRAMVERAAAGDPRIRILPFERDRETMARYLASSDIYVSASRSETFGLSVLEAQACGLPVIGQRAGAMIDRVPESAGILVPGPDPELLAGAVTRMARGDRGALGRRARELAASRNSWETTFTRLLSLYADIRRRRPAGVPRA
jgi:alpha-1,6-mannosyltransferase